MQARKELFLKIVEKLQSLNLFDWIDLQKNQIRNKETMAFPCALISIGSIQYENMTYQFQEGNSTISILILFEAGGDSFDGASDQRETLELFENITKVTDAIQWLQGNSFNELSIVSEEDLTENYNRPAFKLTFETLFYNQLSNPNYVPK